MRNTFVAVALSALANLEKTMGKFLDFMNSAAGASGVGSLLQGASGIIGSAIAARNARKLAAEQNAYNEAMWEKQNAYNTPQAQKQRLIDAGLNPALMYQNGGVSNTAETPAPASDAAVQSPNYIMDGVLAVGQAIGGAVKSALEAVGQNIDNSAKQRDYEEDVAGMPFRLSALESTANIQSFAVKSAEAKSIIDGVAARVGLATEQVQVDSIKQNLENQKADFRQILASIDFTEVRTDREREELQKFFDTYALDIAIKEKTLADLEKGIEVQDSEIAANYALADKYRQDRYLGRTLNGYYQTLGSLTEMERKQFEKWNDQYKDLQYKIQDLERQLLQKNLDNYERDRIHKLLQGYMEQSAKIGYTIFMASHAKRGGRINDGGVANSWIFGDLDDNVAGATLGD